MPDEKCENCRFFNDQRPSEAGGGSRAELYGYCRRQPPSVIQQTLVGANQASMPQTAWPIVGKEDWCGEYKPDPGEAGATAV